MNYVVDLIKMLFPDTLAALFFIVLTLVTLWLYKQIKMRIIDNEKNTVIKVDKAIEAYAELDYEVRRFLKDKSDISLIDTKLIKAGQYLPTIILDSLQDWIDNFEKNADFERLVKLQKEIREEIRRLKLTQLDPVTYRSNGGLTEFITVYYKTKLSSIVEPMFHTVVGIFILMILLLFGSAFASTHEITKQILLISMLIAMMVFILVLDIVISEVVAKGRFVHSFLNWAVLVAFIFSNVVFVFVGPWFRGILMIVITFAYAFFAITFSIKLLGKNKVGIGLEVGNETEKA
jgi:hypothetical protein